jgi:hypothetical protein
MISRGGRSMSIFERVLAVILVMIVAGSCGAATPSTRPADLSSPEAAMMTIVDAMGRGDSRAAQMASTNTDTQLVDLWTKALSSRNALRAALVAKFGDAAKGFPGKDIFDKSIDNARVKEDGDTAILTPNDSDESITLRKVSGDWKVDFSATPILSSYLKGRESSVNAGAEMIRQVATEVEAGKYATVDDVAKALVKRSAAQRASEAAGHNGTAGGGGH